MHKVNGAFEKRKVGNEGVRGECAILQEIFGSEFLDLARFRGRAVSPPALQNAKTHLTLAREEEARDENTRRSSK